MEGGLGIKTSTLSLPCLEVCCDQHETQLHWSQVRLLLQICKRIASLYLETSVVLDERDSYYKASAIVWSPHVSFPKSAVKVWVCLKISGCKILWFVIMSTITQAILWGIQPHRSALSRMCCPEEYSGDHPEAQPHIASVKPVA